MNGLNLTGVRFPLGSTVLDAKAGPKTVRLYGTCREVHKSVLLGVTYRYCRL